MASNHTPQPGPGGGVTLPPTEAQITQKFDLSIALTLSTWPCLSLAVQNSWGGPLSSEKRDWFAGAISDLFASSTTTTTTSTANTMDVEYLEEFLLQIMLDEFAINVEDDSAAEIAAKLIGLRKMCMRGEFGMVDEMYRRWVERRGGGEEERVRFHRQMDDEDDDEDDEEEEEWNGIEDEDGDVDMEEAPQLVKPAKEKVVPKVDEEGFTEVVSKKRR
ncbi:MAG: hypothetical protein LQ350_004484 [Teloschistes chrysophthalmus]|nr:MAG: hypothetical protein LQ350_004484 [Niorma chrysophthalma]